MEFKTIKLEDQSLFERYLKVLHGGLCKYSFASIFLDRALFKVFWTKIKNCICVFAKQKYSCYMLLPPLGKFDKAVLNKCFAIMDAYNQNKSISRIENISQVKKEILQNYGFKIKRGFGEYIYKREDLTQLRGNRFKSKRAGCNYFVKNYNFRAEKFKQEHINGCLRLYQIWARGRKLKFRDAVYQAMLDENLEVHKLAMRNFKVLGLEGLVIKIGSRISAYSLGYRLNKENFCILFEVVDLSKKGLAQYIFKKMCETKSEAYINAMDDSGIASLRKTKLSYRPLRCVPAYVAYRN